VLVSVIPGITVDLQEERLPTGADEIGSRDTSGRI
jgi:hypothetical protein